MKTTLSLLLGIALSCAVCFGTDTDTPAQPPLRVGVSPVFPPMVFKQGKEVAGIEVDFARALGQRLGRKVELVEVPWEDQIEQLREGKTDIIITDSTLA